MEENEFNEFRELLGVSEECIEVNLSGSQTATEWNDQTECWEIEFRDSGVDFLLIHELGHIYLTNIMNYDYLARKPPHFEDIPDCVVPESPIWWCHNAVIDCFVNYRITRFSEIYEYYLGYISAVISRNINPPKLYHWIGGYIEFYLAYNFNLHEEEKREFETDYNRFIKHIKNYIQQNTDMEEDSFDQIDSALNDFGNICSTEDLNEIRNFDFEILRLFPLTLQNLFDLLYPDL